MLTENEGHKIEIRRQSQNKERYFSTELLVKWRSSLPKGIVNSTQDAVTQIHKIDIHYRLNELVNLSFVNIHPTHKTLGQWVCGAVVNTSCPLPDHPSLHQP